MSADEIVVRIPEINADLVANLPFYVEPKLRIRQGTFDVLERTPGRDREIFYVSAAAQNANTESLVREKFGGGFYGVWSFSKSEVIMTTKNERDTYPHLKA